MIERRLRVLFAGLVVFLGSFLLLYAQANLSVKDIVRKNIQAAGGKEALSEINHYSFKHDLTFFCLKLILTLRVNKFMFA